MLKTAICCDMCEKELPCRTVNTPVGAVEVVKTAKTEVWNTSYVLPHLCKECALKIDNALLSAKIQIMLEIDAALKKQRFNKKERTRA